MKVRDEDIDMKHRTPHDRRTTTPSKETPNQPKKPTPKPPINPNANPTSWAGEAANNMLDVEFTTPPATKPKRHQSPPGSPAHEDPK